MNLSDFRAKAREKLSRKWLTAVGITFAYSIITFLFNIILKYTSETLSTILSICFTIINIPLSYGLLIQFIKFYNGEDTSLFSFFKLGFNNFIRAWKVSLNVILKLLVPYILFIATSILIVGFSILSYNQTSLIESNIALLSILLIVLVAGFFISLIWIIVKSYYYVMSNIISIEEPDLLPKEAVIKSKELMTNNRWKFFLLNLSFIGWSILSVLTFGIGTLWLTPYIQLTHIAFYKYISKKEDVI